MSNSSAAWIPLEANPEVLRTYARRLGVSDAYSFHDVFGFDEDLLAFIPRPVIALLLLFPITPKYEEFRREEDQRLTQDPSTRQPPADLYFMRQTIPNACGTIALLHAFANNRDAVPISDGPLSRFLERTATSTPAERAAILERDTDLASHHAETSSQGQSAVPDAEIDVDLHFVALVSHNGRIYELDGRKSFPIDHGPVAADLLVGAVPVIQRFMEREPDAISFNVIALAPSSDD